MIKDNLITKIKKLKRSALLALAGLYLSGGIMNGHPTDLPSIFPEEDKIRTATKDLGGLGEITMGLYYLNQHYENGSKISKPGIHPTAIGSMFIDNNGYVHDYTIEKAWMDFAESRNVFAEQMRDDLAKISDEEYQKLPQTLREVVDQSRKYARVHLDLEV